MWTFTIFITILVLGITMVAMNTWGTHLLDYQQYSDAFMSVVFLSMGLVNFEGLRKYNFVWSYLYFVIYSIFIIYILISGFMIIYIDTYRRIIILNGAGKDQQQEGSQDHVSSVRGFLMWFFGWLPSKWAKRVFTSNKDNEYEDEQEKDED